MANQKQRRRATRWVTLKELMEKQKQTEEGVKEKPNIIERLQHGRGFSLMKECCTYYYNYEERIDRETYRELRKELYDYLEKNCEMADRSTFYFDDLWEVVVELYNCPVGKVGVIRYGDFSNVDDAYMVSVGDKAWQRVKNQAIEVLKDWRNAAEEEPYYYINPDEIERDIRKLMSMPE